jgi:hypothetical protein
MRRARLRHTRRSISIVFTDRGLQQQVPADEAADHGRMPQRVADVGRGPSACAHQGSCARLLSRSIAHPASWQQNEGATEVVLFHRLLDGICETKFTEKQAAHAWTEGSPRSFSSQSDSCGAWGMTGHPMLVISLNVDAASRYFLFCLLLCAPPCLAPTRIAQHLLTLAALGLHCVQASVQRRRVRAWRGQHCAQPGVRRVSAEVLAVAAALLVSSHALATLARSFVLRAVLRCSERGVDVIA